MANKNRKNSGKKSEEPDLQQIFEEEIQKPYYQVDYLDNFKLPYEKLDVSAIIPSYNRCPYKPNSLKGELNPLAWAIQSLLFQKPPLKEIIIVDDKSEDYTKDVVDSFKEEAKEKGVKLIYSKNQKRSSSYISRNVGAANANSKYLFYVDDDSIMAPYAAFGAVFTYEWLKKKGINIGVLNLPPYSRTSIPNKIVKKSNIGHIDFSQGEYTGNKNAFPEEYLSEEKKFIHDEFHILEPVHIKNNGGYILCEKDIYLKVGGFMSENILKRFGDRDFGCKVMENGYAIYYQPDPKFHCVHGSYGLNMGKEFEGPDWFRKIGGMISIKKAMKECDKPSKNTGHRIDVDEYYYQVLLSVFYMLYSRNKKGAKKWLTNVYNKFVKKGDLSLFDTSSEEVPSEKERKKMWNKAIKEGLNFIAKKEKKELETIKETIKKIKEEGKEDIPKILEQF